MTKILKDIYSDFQLSSLLGFKGGTALYLFYNLPRFSVDLDFNLLDLSKKDVAHRNVKKIVRKYGELKDEFIKRNTIFFLLSYGGPDRNIKIEISLSEFPNEYETKQYLGLPVLVMKREYMAAHKLVALTERKGVANRDIFDIWYFLKSGWSIKDEIVELRTGMTVTEYIPKCIEFIESAKRKSILQGLGEVLDPKLKGWAKNHLASDAIFYLRYYLEEINK
jgi:predicted nucleotidyltransferase component of viral defense system